jgi:predicted RNase H-like HicB family nuclease
MKTPSDSYNVNVQRSGKWWALTFPGLPSVFTQAKRLDQVEGMAREAIGFWFDLPNQTYLGEVNITVTPPQPAAELIGQLNEAIEVAGAASETIRVTRKGLATMLTEDEGLPLRDVGELIGVSFQRVSQILAE